MLKVCCTTALTVSHPSLFRHFHWILLFNIFSANLFFANVCCGPKGTQIVPFFGADKKLERVMILPRNFQYLSIKPSCTHYIYTYDIIGWEIQMFGRRSTSFGPQQENGPTLIYDVGLIGDFCHQGVTSVTKGGTQKLPKKYNIVETY
jgi:hypothetical protein